MIVLKTSHELSLMREACRISAGALKVAGEAVEPGVTTAQIDKIAHEYILKAGATPTFLLLGTPCYAALRQVVWRHFDRDLISRKNADVVHPELTGDMSQYLVAVFQLDCESRVGQGLYYRTFNLDHILL